MPKLLSLFDGTGSICKPFAAAGWEIESVDIDGRHGATTVCDVRDWNYYACECPDVIFAGVPCEQYSIARTRAKTPRNYKLADECVAATWRIIQHFLQQNEGLWFFVENPASSHLWKREVANVFPCRSILSFCSYNAPYQKKTRIAHNSTWEPRPICSAQTCPHYGKHPKTAQKAETRGWRVGAEDRCTLDELHEYPGPLCQEIFERCQAHVWHEVSA